MPSVIRYYQGQEALKDKTKCATVPRSVPWCIVFVDLTANCANISFLPRMTRNIYLNRELREIP